MLQFFKQYIPYYKDYKKYFFYAFIGMVMVSLGTSGTAYVIKPVLDDVFIKQDEQMLYVIPFAVILLYSLKGFGSFIQTYYIAYIGSDIIRRVRDKFLSHILMQDIRFFNEKHGGELTSRVSNDTSAIQGAVSTSIAVIIVESFTIVGLIGVVIYQSPKLAFYGLVVIPLVIYPLSLLAKRMMPEYQVISCPANDKNTRSDNWYLSKEGRARVYQEMMSLKWYAQEQKIEDAEVDYRK